MVAVSLSPRTAAKHTIRRGATAERSNGTVAFNRRSATRDHNTPSPWTEVHDYHHALAPRGCGFNTSAGILPVSLNISHAGAAETKRSAPVLGRSNVRQGRVLVQS